VLNLQNFDNTPKETVTNFSKIMNITPNSDLSYHILLCWQAAGVLTNVLQPTVGLVKSSCQISIIDSKQNAHATSRSSADW